MDISANRTALPSRFPTRSLALLAIIGLLLAALVAAALLAAGSRPRLPAPFGPAADGSMVYQDAGDIHVAATDGTSRVLVAGPTNDFSPWFANDGTKFAFLREEGDELLRLMVADSEGGNVRSLSGEPLYQPDWWTWSPDGSQLVVFHTVDNARVISIVDATGGGALRTLDLGGVVPEGWVDWRPPDGRQLVFRGNPTPGSVDRALYTVGVDGSGTRQIAPVLQNENAYEGTDISSDGSRLAYWNWEADDSDDRMGGHAYILDIGSGVDTLVAVDATSESQVTPLFSPDGSQLLVELQQPGQLVVAPADGSGPGISIGPAFAFDHPHAFDFAPDGEAVILTVDDVTRVYRISDGATLSESVHPFPTWQRIAP